MLIKRKQKISSISEESDYKKVSGKEFWYISGWVFSLFFKKEPFYTTLSLVFTAIANLNDLINTLIIGKMVDTLISVANSENSGIRELYPYIGILIGYNMFNHFLNFLSHYSDTALNWLMRPKLNQALQERMKYLGIQTLERPDINDKLQRSEESSQNLSAYMGELVELVSEVVKITLSFLVIVKFFPLFAPLMLLLSAPYSIHDRKFRVKSYQFMYDKTPDMRRAGMSSQDLRNATKLNEISIVGAYKFLNDKYYQFHYWYEKQRVTIYKSWKFGSALSRIFNDLAVYAGYFVVFKDLLNNVITVGDTTFRISVINRLSLSYQMAIKTYNNIMETSVRVRDVYFLFHTAPAFEDGAIEMPKLDKGPEIQIKNMSFSYPNTEKQVFNNITLSIKSGEKIAIVGHNGAGKTTLVKLLCRIYLPTSGSILVNKYNLKDLKIDSWYRNSGILFQEYNTYPQLTAKESIIIGRSEEPVDEIALHLAAQSADATEFIDELPAKYDQVLSEKFKGGVRPSTGQWQKLAIARFFYRNAPLVIFDEPTASIDAVSEYNIFNRIYDFFRDKTVIIISHRFSTVRNADRIVVLDHGVIVEDGSHEDLLSKDGYYAKAFMLQAKGYSQ